MEEIGKVMDAFDEKKKTHENQLATAKNDLEIEKSHRQELETRRKALKMIMKLHCLGLSLRRKLWQLLLCGSHYLSLKRKQGLKLPQPVTGRDQKRKESSKKKIGASR